MTDKQINNLIEALIESGTLDARLLTTDALAHYKTVEPNYNRIIKVFDEYEETVQQISVKIYVQKSMFNMLTSLSQIQDISHLIILNNMFSERHNNNQLKSSKLPFKITDETFEMYSSVLNSNTFKLGNKRQSYCSMFKDVGSIGRDTDLLPFLQQKTWGNLQLIINPPFTELMIKQAINNVRDIINNTKYKSLYVYITVPLWSEEDYKKGGVYYPLTEMGFERSVVQKYDYVNTLSGKHFYIKTSVFEGRW